MENNRLKAMQQKEVCALVGLNSKQLRDKMKECGISIDKEGKKRRGTLLPKEIKLIFENIGFEY
ncbi:hypothetical protein [Flavobacterium filum]|uniref:hypothetical protein n=1 Tax=Flavobacterium filum TaxID=370974 RepID=UPI0023F12C1B|nr:hypothetical protein [Flavobacterium filum]